MQSFCLKILFQLGCLNIWTLLVLHEPTKPFNVTSCASYTKSTKPFHILWLFSSYSSVCTTMDRNPLAPVFCSLALSATAYSASDEKCRSTCDMQAMAVILLNACITTCIYLVHLEEGFKLRHKSILRLG